MDTCLSIKEKMANMKYLLTKTISKVAVIVCTQIFDDNNNMIFTYDVYMYINVAIVKVVKMLKKRLKTDLIGFLFKILLKIIQNS